MPGPTVPPPAPVPRIVLAAPGSGAGKTTVSFGLMAALGAAGDRVAPFKVGPDYIDPGYHALATGRPGRNLDPYLCGEDLMAPLLLHGAAGADVAVIEGVMGLYDGRLGETPGRGGHPVRGFGSTAHVATLLDAPVLLVLDAAHASRTTAAVAHGLATYPGAPRIAGVLLNRAGSPRAIAETERALADVGLPLFGALPRTPDLVIPSRHLGLVTAAEWRDAREAIEVAGRVVADHVALDAVRALAASAPVLDVGPWDPAAVTTRVPGRPRVAVAGGRAFTFRYAETTELLDAAGCDVVAFDPLADDALPAGTSALYLGGGFPELHAEDLAGNAPLREDIRAAVAAGLPTYAECAGLLYLARTLDGLPMAGALPVDARMAPRLTLGYHEAVAASDSVVTRAGERVRAHEFHRTVTEPSADGPDADASPPIPALGTAWTVADPARGLAAHPEGSAGPSVLASYQHVHWAGHPRLAQRFADAAAAFASSGTSWTPRAAVRTPPPDLDHHGDADLRPGAVDLAVNVREGAPPDWLVRAVVADPDAWAAYPDPTRARDALATRHGVDPACVLPAAGGAEAFALIARALTPAVPVVVHPQFTEPEAALREAGARVRRVYLCPAAGFALDPSLVPSRADLVVVGNPTNPTGVLHPASALQSLRRPGRTLVVDEAFMDFVPGEPESLISGDLTGLLVARSLTKMWGIAGLRAGYVVGDPALIERLAAQQGPWAVPTPALDAMIACSTPEALAEADAVATRVEADRAHLVAALGEAGYRVPGDPRTPFVLVDTAPAGPASVRQPLLDAGFAVRRGETFPGLGPSWVRVAVRSPETSLALARALETLRLHREDA
ncbi:cobyrinate a,c-diamide synthase [Nigerium massiliense]|uniref:cobyrinate a,c-diamide synthase n=1 Tax=Nigerium massiliense TaxID=1522317 RepID=UPI00058CBC96|nr:cobyrinate a,c-diamide synthase [Nigerium massiliense]